MNLHSIAVIMSCIVYNIYVRGDDHWISRMCVNASWKKINQNLQDHINNNDLILYSIPDTISLIKKNNKTQKNTSNIVAKKKDKQYCILLYLLYVSVWFLCEVIIPPHPSPTLPLPHISQFFANNTNHLFKSNIKTI